jgi:hypothetical protein
LIKRERTVSRSFRISESASRVLQDEAENRGISANTLLNQLLLTFSEYDRFLNEFHMVKLSSATFHHILEAGPDDVIVQAGRSAGSSIPQSFVLAKFGELTERNVLEYLKLVGRYSSVFEFNFIDRPGSRTLTLVHELGHKWSLFLGEYAKAALETAGTKARISYGDDSVTCVLLDRDATKIAREASEPKERLIGR